MPEGWSYIEVAGVACDSQDRVYVFNRGAHPMIVFDKEGKFLNAWGEGMFKGPHGIFIDRHDNLWLADDKDHTVHKFTTDGKKLMTLGESGKAADTGYKIGASPVQARRGAVSSRHQRRGAAGRRHVHRRRLRQRPRPQVLEGREAALLVGRAGAADRGSSYCRTASRSTARGSSTSPTARIRACRSSIPRASTCANGRSSTARTTSSSTTRTCCISPRAASTTT